MKTVKRIFAVLILTVVVITVGYLFFTGGRLNGDTEQTVTETNYAKEDITY